MKSNKCRLILFTGEKHCGKTTSLQKIIDKLKKENFGIAGFIAPSVYEGAFLSGFDLVDIQSRKSVNFARCKPENKIFIFGKEGLDFGNSVLQSEKTRQADLIIIDEYGPLEIEGGGWRNSVDSLIGSTNAIILLVVRKKSIEKVKQLYKDIPCEQLSAADAQSIDKIIAMLKSRHGQ